MKYIKIISLSIIIFICCISPVISAEVNETGDNNNDLNVADNATFNSQNNLGKKYANFNIFFLDSINKTYSQGDDIHFGIEYNIMFDGLLEIYLDGEHITTVYPEYGHVYIKLINYHLSPGTHWIKCQTDGDDSFYSESCSECFYIV